MSQLKKLEEERSALQLRLQQEEHRTQDASRRVEVAIQETRSLENVYRSSQAEILQLKSQCDELRRSHAELQAENVQSASNLMAPKRTPYLQ
jgi:chromosome segregation ATPase